MAILTVNSSMEMFGNICDFEMQYHPHNQRSMQAARAMNRSIEMLILKTI